VLKGNVLSLTLQTYGCRVIQKALEVIDQEDQTMVAGVCHCLPAWSSVPKGGGVG